MTDNHSRSCYTELALNNALRYSTVMKLLLHGRKYHMNLSGEQQQQQQPEPPLDLSYSTGVLASGEQTDTSATCKRRPGEPDVQAAGKRKCIRCDFVAEDADTSYLHYQLHRKLQSGIDLPQCNVEQRQHTERDATGNVNPDESSTLRTLLRRYKLPVVSCSSPSCLRTAAPTYTRYGYSSGSDSRSVESTPSVSPYHGYVGSRISSPTDRFVSDFGPPNAGPSAEPSPTSSSVDSQACTTLDKAFVKCEQDKHGAESYYSRSVAFPKRPKLEVIEPAESVPVSPSPDSASLARMRRWSPRDDRVLEPEADDNRVIGPAGGLMSSARSPETRSCRIVTESRDASIQCDLASEDATCSAMPESVTSPETSCRCQYCGITFDDDVMYSIHMGCHNHRDPFICNVCGKRSDNKYTFYTHIMRGHEYS